MNIGTILSVVLAVLVVVIILARIGINLYLKYGHIDTAKCPKCKGTMIITKSYLYVLPACFDQTHEQTWEYYLQNAVPIDDESQIPTGNQSCYMHIMQCQDCGYKNVHVIDFLKVRESAVLKDGEEYPYETFREFLEERENNI